MNIRETEGDNFLSDFTSNKHSRANVIKMENVIG